MEKVKNSLLTLARPTMLFHNTIRSNPAAQNITVSVTLPEARTATVHLVNMAGVRVLESRKNLLAGENVFTLPAGNISAGTYYLVLSTGYEKLQAKLVKQ